MGRMARSPNASMKEREIEMKYVTATILVFVFLFTFAFSFAGERPELKDPKDKES
jgi:hypothetical protein